MQELKLQIGKYVEFYRKPPYTGAVIGRVLRIRGNMLTVILSPFGIKGKRKGQRQRIEKKRITGIVHWKKVRPWKYTT